MASMVYVYILQSSKDHKLYVGCTENLKLRFEQHIRGYAAATKLRRPFSLVYYEACLSKSDALHREKYLKTAYGKRYIKKRLKSYFMG